MASVEQKNGTAPRPLFVGVEYVAIEPDSDKCEPCGKHRSEHPRDGCDGFIPEPRRVSLGDEPIHESRFDTLGALYKFAQKEYGRCVSRVYVDRAGHSVPIGWVFLKRAQYEEYQYRMPRNTYLQEAWVTVHTAPATVTRTEHLLNIQTGREV
jgi:hypothetical protein